MSARRPLVRSARRALLATGFVAATAAVHAQDPAFANVFHLDAEYGLDRLSNDLPWDWRDAFRASPDGFQVTAGSLNIRHFLVEQRLKVRPELVRDRFWFRFRHERRQGLDVDETGAEMELEVRAARALFLSLFGEPTFRKADTDAGVAARWGRDEGRSLRVAYAWPDFDTNHAFHNHSVNEGYEEFYRRYPQEARVDATWIGDRLRFSFMGRHRRPSELHHRDLAPGGAEYLLRGSLTEGALDARLIGERWTVAAEGETRRDRAAREDVPAAPGTDQSVTRERHTGRVTLERRLAGAWRLRTGGELARARGRDRRPGLSALDEGYKVLDRIAFAGVERRPSPRWGWDATYLYDRQWWETLDPGGVLSDGRPSQNRARLGLRRDVSERAYFRAVVALELDRGQAEHFSSFDGGTLQFQTTF